MNKTDKVRQERKRRFKKTRADAERKGYSHIGQAMLEIRVGGTANATEPFELFLRDAEQRETYTQARQRGGDKTKRLRQERMAAERAKWMEVCREVRVGNPYLSNTETARRVAARLGKPEGSSRTIYNRCFGKKRLKDASELQ